MEKVYLSSNSSLAVILLMGLIFIVLGHFNRKKKLDNSYYIVGDRNENTFALTSSISASALGAWILFGPASAATWGGIGAVTGYALGTAAPMLFLYNFGPKIRKELPKGLSLTEFIDKRFGKIVLKICLFLIIFYLTIFLIAEVTAISSLLKYISNTSLWKTSALTLLICLTYILRGGFKLSIETDKYQFIFLSIIIILSIYFILGNLGSSSWDLIKNKSSNLIDKDYIPNYTAFLTFFIAVAATNLFHQGNWQRVFSAKNNNILKTSLIYSSIITFTIVFWFGYSGLISISINSEIVPDLAFFEIMLKNQNLVIVLAILILAISLTLSTIDTLINAISSIFIINGSDLNKNINKNNIKRKSNYIIIIICLITFIISSKGLSILYLFLLADLFCCAAVITIFYGFFNKSINTKIATVSIISGIISGILFFPNQNFQSSILIGNIISENYINNFILSNLLFVSFMAAILIPMLILLIYSLRNSFK